MSTINKMNTKLLVKFWGVFLYSSLVVAAFIGIFFKFEYDEKHTKHTYSVSAGMIINGLLVS